MEGLSGGRNDFEVQANRNNGLREMSQNPPLSPFSGLSVKAGNTCHCAMITIDNKAEIDYPCLWLYKLIGLREEEIIKAVEEIMPRSGYTLSSSKSSRTGKYLSFNLEVMVHSEEARNFYYASLKQHAAITMVL